MRTNDTIEYKIANMLADLMTEDEGTCTAELSENGINYRVSGYYYVSGYTDRDEDTETAVVTGASVILHEVTAEDDEDEPVVPGLDEALIAHLAEDMVIG